MPNVAQHSKITRESPVDYAALIAENQQLRQQLQALEDQLAWFKCELFGRKSEKRLIEPNPAQGSLFEGLETLPPASTEPAEPETKTSRRGKAKKRRGAEDVNDEGLRFGPDVPVERIDITPDELSGPDADQYQIIGEKVTRRLAQRPGSYVVLEYVWPVLKHRPTQSLVTPPAPSAIFDGCIADVSVLAGILVDKFCYHLPLYRQHQRLRDAGISLSRSTLTNWTKGGIDLLTLIVDAQERNALRSRILAMDETPIKAGKAGKGKMHQGYRRWLETQPPSVAITAAAHA